MHPIIRCIAFAFVVLLVAPLSAADHATPRGAASATKLQSRIVADLEWQYSPPLSFKVEVDNPGDVVLKGSVPSYWDKRNIFAIVSRVQGVREISDRLVVETELVPDDVIKAEIEHYLQKTRAIEDPNKIQVAVSNGLVILRGTVDLPREKSVAEDIASWYSGVKSVENEIEVLSAKKAVSDDNLLSVIQDMIIRDFPLEKKTVQVNVDKGRVLLSGAVNRLWLRHELEKEVRQVWGVREVQDNIQITPNLS